MSDETKGSLLFITVIVGLILLVFGISLIRQHQTDQYCKTTPLDRIDRKRCGLEKTE
jgi:hypothetical protein